MSCLLPAKNRFFSLNSKQKGGMGKNILRGRSNKQYVLVKFKQEEKGGKDRRHRIIKRCVFMLRNRNFIIYTEKNTVGMTVVCGFKRLLVSHVFYQSI